MTARVLVVDDIPANVKLLEARLGAEYFEVSTASSGEQALAKIAKEAPDIVLLDVMMPGMDGFALARALRALPGERSRLPLIALTGEDAARSRGRCLAAGCDAWLAKPVEPLTLGATIDRVLGARRGDRADRAPRAGPD